MEDPYVKAMIKSSSVVPHIRSLYDAGTPLFTKEVIRDVQRQLKDFEDAKNQGLNAPNVYLQGIDGEMVNVEQEIGPDVPLGPNETIDVEPVQESLIIDFKSFEELTLPGNTSYCSISVQYGRESKALTTHPMHHVESFFEASRNEWEASEPCHQLRSLLMSTPVPYHVSRIVAFACASLAIKKPEDLSPGQAYQHTLILTLRDILQDKQGGNREISCYA